MTGPADSYAGLVQRPTMRPWVSGGFGPRLSYVDAAGRTVCLALTEIDLAQLALSIAETQAALARRRLDASPAEALP
jgi:hypothetical protein